MASSANAEGTGARVRRRKLKSGKSGKSTKGGTNADPNFTVDPNALIPAPVTAPLEQMREKCSVEAESTFRERGSLFVCLFLLSWITNYNRFTIAYGCRL